ncbi:MAG: hypothetical protein GX309_05995, partial [Clostridiales bacterium]|nr:hypothetical protein [Clostridiales bacterium]
IENNNEVVISIRDNGEPFDILESHSEDNILSEIKVIRAISKNIEYSNVLGFNRIMIRI